MPVAGRNGPIEGNLDRAGAAADGVRSAAVVVIQAFAGLTISRIVVVRMVCGDALLIEQRSYAVVVAHHEDDVALVVLDVGEQRKVDAAGPGGGHGQGIARSPVAGNQPSSAVNGTGRLLDAIERAGML